MRYVLLLSLSLVLVLCVVNLGVAQTHTAKIVVKGVSPQLVKAGRYNAISTGLPNVGKGQKVWLEAQSLYTPSDLYHTYLDTIISESWDIVNPPGGFVTIVHTDTTTYFIPDTTGQYRVDLSVTSSHGTVSTSLYINSAYWVGVGNIVGSATLPECASCHTDKESEWKGTNHATAFQRKLDDATGHFAGYCVSCHSVGYDVLGTAVNNGFDDIKTATGWVFPSPLQAGNWDSMKTHYPTLAAKANIQCENCHGPGSLHMGDKTNNKIAVSLSSDVCGQCHDALTHHTKNYEWDNSKHARSLVEGSNIEYMNRSSCSRCHTAQGFVDEIINGKPSGAPYTDVQPVSCAACHDPHSNSNPFQLRRSSIADACTGCHTVRVSTFSGLHHSHQGDMLKGISGNEIPGYKYPSSSHSQIPDRCVDCHMAAPPADSLYGLPQGTLGNKLGGHSFSIIWDHGTPDDKTDDIVNPTGCRSCHGEVSLAFVEESQTSIHVLLDSLRAMLPHRTSGDTTAPKFHFDASLTKIQQAASYNWYFVNNDGSFGVHNHDYARALLQASIEQIQLGAGAGDVVSIKDVPNDQGKQVQIVWNQFPAEKYGIEPVLYYQLWRMDSATVVPKTVPSVNSFKEMLTKATAGSRYVLNGSVWTWVGRVDAARLSKYSYIAPTLYDSTIVGGLKAAVFYISGHTVNPNVVYASMPDTGYSVDNLAPAPPAITSNSGVGTAIVDLSTPVDNDFKYFAIYRGTTPNFVPSGMPLGTTSNPQYIDATVANGQTYYYKATAFDFSGNESKLSNEVSVLVTSVKEDQVPTEFALRQNHPNPFNPSTHIQYELPKAAHVKISIYNSLGMLVTTLVDQTEDVGYHYVIWNGTDNNGNSVSTGIYLYKMEAGTYTAIKKMLFVK